MPASEMTYTVSGGALNSARSLTLLLCIRLRGSMSPIYCVGIVLFWMSFGPYGSEVENVDFWYFVSIFILIL